MLTLKKPFNKIEEIKEIKYNASLIHDKDLLELIQSVFQIEPEDRPKIKDIIRIITKKLNSLGLNLDFEEIINEIDQIEETQIEPLTENTDSNQ